MFLTRFYRAFFSWVTVGGLVGTCALGFLQLERFWIVYISLGLAAVAAVGAWLRSDFLASLAPDSLSRAQRRDPGRVRTANRKYRLWKWGASGGILLVAGILFLFAWNEEERVTLSKREGLLQPADEPTPSVAGCSRIPPLPRGTPALYMGASRFHTSSYPHSPFVRQDGRLGPKDVFLIERTKHNHLSLTLDIRSRDQKIVARIVKNEFLVNANNSLSMKRPDRSTLIVVDQEGREVVDLRYLNPYAVRFRGVLHFADPETTIEITDDEIVMKGAGGMEFYRVRELCSSYSPTGNGVLFIPPAIEKP